MKYLKSFNESNSEDDLYRQLSENESKYYLDRTREVITSEEFMMLSDIQSKYYRNGNNGIVYKEDSCEYTFNYLSNPYQVNNPIEIIKIDDDWWIIIFLYNLGAFPDDSVWLCDTIDGVEEWFKDI